jgi:hypothetical protein
MANKPNTKRNDEIVMLHDFDPIQYSFASLANRYTNSRTKKPLSRSTIHEIYVREKAKRGDKKAQFSGVVKAKYPSLKPC